MIDHTGIAVRDFAAARDFYDRALAPLGASMLMMVPPEHTGGVKVCGYVDTSYWRDMGTPEDFVRGSADLVRGIAPSPALGAQRVSDAALRPPFASRPAGSVPSTAERAFRTCDRNAASSIIPVSTERRCG